MKTPGYELLTYYILITLLRPTYSFLEGRSCLDHNDCAIAQGYFCRDNMCMCDHPCEGENIYRLAKYQGERCVSDHECIALDRNLICTGKIDRSCKCRRMHVWDIHLGRCMKADEDALAGIDPVQNVIIPTIILMSVGAMVYLGFKLFCNCGKLWRRSRSQLSRDLDAMSQSPHQQATWVASYRVFSPLGSQNRAPVHSTPCMGLFLPSQTISSSPPPYEEALKHKVILSSYHPAGPGPPPQMPVQMYVPQPSPDNALMPMIVSTQSTRISYVPEGDQIRPLRYYPGDENPQIPAVWTSQRAVEPDTETAARQTPMTTFRSSRGFRSPRPISQRRYSQDAVNGATRESET